MIGRPKLYDWAGWFARGRFVLAQGQDFDCTLTAFVGQLRNEASARRLHLEVTVNEASHTVTVAARRKRA